MWVHGMGHRPLQPPQLLWGARWVEGVYDEPKKNLNLLFFSPFSRKWGETFKKMKFFTYGLKQWFYLTHSGREYFEKLAFKRTRNAPLNGCISKARASSESRLTFSESWLNFLRHKVVFCMLYPRGYTTEGCPTYNPWCRCHRLAGLKELMTSQHKFWVCFFLPLSLENEVTISRNCAFSLLDQSIVFV